jgi:hypothetical protein
MEKTNRIQQHNTTNRQRMVELKVWNSMEDLRLTKEQKIGYLIELRILFQRSIEILDELKSMDHRSKTIHWIHN